MRVLFQDLLDAMARVQVRPTRKDLEVSEFPRPFEPPPLLVEEGVAPKAEVLFVGGSAAMGKSTCARALSNQTGAPLLDLARVAVGADSLRGLLQSAYGTSALDLFHRGELPVIVDAVDEGRLHSGPAGLADFFRTSGQLLGENRMVGESVKLVVFGRPDAVRWAAQELKSACAGVKSGRLRVDFFEKHGAERMVELYADHYASEGSAYKQHRARALGVREAYFAALGNALGVEEADLWSREEVRAFAGYAPVLAAVGTALARIDNFQRVENRLRSVGGAREAWSVLEEVLVEVLDREREKLVAALNERIGWVPEGAYDRSEQLRLLGSLLSGKPVVAKRLGVSAEKEVVYQEVVRARLPEHAFLREGKPANVVFASYILAEAVGRGDTLAGEAEELIGEVSREPFLWRCLESRLGGNDLIDGACLGYVLNSLWNEPVEGESGEGRVGVEVVEEGGCRVVVEAGRGARVEFRATLPLVLFEQARHFALEAGKGEVKIVGRRGKTGTAWFRLGESVVLECRSLDVEADVVQVTGWVELGAQEIQQRREVRLLKEREARLVLRGAVGNVYPWSQQGEAGEREAERGGRLGRLVELCWGRIKTAPSHLYENWGVPDGPLSWIKRQGFEEMFVEIIRAAAEMGLVEIRRKEVSGPLAMLVVSVGGLWRDMLAALEGRGEGGQVAGLVAELRRRWG